MPRPFPRAIALLTAVVTAVLTLGGPATAATPARQARPARPHAGPAARVLLITGADCACRADAL